MNLKRKKLIHKYMPMMETPQTVPSCKIQTKPKPKPTMKTKTTEPTKPQTTEPQKPRVKPTFKPKLKVAPKPETIESGLASDSEEEEPGPNQYYERWINGEILLVSTDNKRIYDPETMEHIGNMFDDSIDWCI